MSNKAGREKVPVELFGLQILRGFAATAVVASHILRISDTVAGRFSPYWLTLSLSSGVDIFFVISGFIMFYATFARGGPTIAPGEFMLRRVVRIYPFYWFCCLALMALVATHIFKARVFAIGEVLQSMALVPGHHSLIDMSWTLSYEMFFYLVFAATLTVRSKRVTVIATSAFIVAAYVVGNLVPDGPVRSFLGGSVVLEFCFGLGLAYVTVGRSGAVRVPWPLLALALALIAVAPVFVPHPTVVFLAEPYRAVVWGLPAIVVVAAFLALKPARGFAARWLVRLGDASYAVYLTHLFVVIAYSKALQVPMIAHTNQILVAPLAIATSLVVGLIAHYVVEKPLLRSSRNLVRVIGLSRSTAAPVVFRT